VGWLRRIAKASSEDMTLELFHSREVSADVQSAAAPWMVLLQSKRMCHRVSSTRGQWLVILRLTSPASVSGS
jgi:hypothetical protein